MDIRHRFLLVLSIAVMFQTFISGCDDTLRTRIPDLPPGFETTIVPTDLFSVYLYVSSGEAIAVPTSYIIDHKSIPPTLMSSIPEAVDLDMIRFWAVPTNAYYGAIFDFTSPDHAQIIARSIKLLADSSSTTLMESDSDLLTFLKGPSSWTSSAKEALTPNNMIAIQEAYPDAWETILLLPEDPPYPSIAAGFIQLDDNIIESITSTVGIAGRGLTSGARFIQINDLAFAVYSKAPLIIPDQINIEYFLEANFGAVLVGQSSYPGFVLSVMLNAIESRSPFSKTALNNGTTAYHLNLDKLHLLLSHKGDIVFASIGPSKTQAESLLMRAVESSK